MHRHLGKREKGHNENLTSSHKAKRQLLHLARGDPRVPDSSRSGEPFISLSLVLPPWPLPAPPGAALAGPWGFWCPCPLPAGLARGEHAQPVPLPHGPCGQLPCACHALSLAWLGQCWATECCSWRDNSSCNHT